MKHRILLFVFLLSLLSFTSLAAQDVQYNESPMLAARVAAGELPPVAERLPSNPRVVSFDWSQIGTYGGDFRDPFVGDAFWSSQMVFWTFWKGLVTWNETYSDWMPNIAESVDVSDDARMFTFHIRPGVKWSDGVPFTADDVLFVINDIYGNPELNGGSFPSGWLKPGQEAPVAEKIDDLTFSLTFDVPYGMFLLNMAGWPGWELVTAPKHYLEQFHIAYNPDGIDELIAQTEGAEDWVSLFQAHSAVGPGTDAAVISRDVNYPTMFPWIYTQPMGTGTQFIAERNPYYYWVDAAGNQLPYIDRIVGSAYQDDQTMLVDVLAGEYDTMANTTDLQRPLFFENEATSGLSVYQLQSEGGGKVSIMFNMTHPELGSIFSERDFRIAMSYAINRDEVIDIVYFGQGEARQVSPIEDSPLYNEQLTTQYLEYNVDEANAHLDLVLPDKDGDGFRLNPATGERLTIVMTVQSGDYGLRFTDVAELLKQYYADVGIDLVVDVVDNSIWTERRNDNSMEATVFTGEGGYGITAITDPRYFVPVHGQSIWGNAWNLWYLEPNNPNAVEPPQEIKDHIALYEQVRQAPTSEQRIELMSQVLQTAADNFWVIGISSATGPYRPLSARLANVPETWVDGWNPGGPAIAFPEQWFYRPE
ncbi:MAG: ABC transporter substrate-binding protein [Chloroflexi bacterium]|uniref:ABC transporter substrate-binding protein n=1 Tax=Candidatus Flexifilum breve TaxID=3140694 RepID=UPI0031348F43|nr:ABC transporter substrate-binding protein [Chloroflexota bacterium]